MSSGTRVAGQIITELSGDLLRACRTNAEAAVVSAPCAYRQLPPADSSAFTDTCVDLVIVRSILNYIEDRAAALNPEISRASDRPPLRRELAKEMFTAPDHSTLEEAFKEALGTAEAERLIAVVQVEVASARRAVRFPKATTRATCG